jgi:septum formation protein
VIPSVVDERLDPGPFTETIARLAEAKARAVAASQPGSVILAADTMVIVDGEALGKPADRAGAVAMLRRLRGRAHEVMTGVAAFDARTAQAWTGTEVSCVVMARYPDALIERYVESGAPLDKAGGYAIQDLDGALVDTVVGSYTNVIGLPLRLTVRLLASAGVRLSGWGSS